MFTYDWYTKMVLLLKEKGYNIADYDDFSKYDRCVILRHDIDTSIEKALEMAQVENDLGISSTYFVMLRSDLYNVASKKNINMIKRIIGLGHNIGLHFDEEYYSDEKVDLIKCIKKEAEMLSELLDYKVKSFSMHRPSPLILKADFFIEGLNNSYSEIFFKKIKYLSDSRRNWREPVIDIIESNEYDKLHILTHPFWYKKEETTIKETLKDFIEVSKSERYDTMKENFTKIEEILEKEEI